MRVFKKSFTLQEPIPAAGIASAIAVMNSGRLHRYDVDPGELGEVSLLEREFADFLGMPYCLACASGGYAIYLALSAAGVQAGDKVLSNAFTLAPVPGAIHNAGASPVFIEMAEDYCIDLDDLDAKASACDARVLLLSHMRGHIADMDRVLEICQRHSLFLIEDCAHTMGGGWNGRPSGRDADIACFSTQTYKHLNSGEGGLLCCRDSDVMAKATVMSGSYMMFERHGAGAEASSFNEAKWLTPNCSGRMDHLRAAILRPQLLELTQRCERWNSLYAVLEDGLRALSAVRMPVRRRQEQFVGSSIQFSLPGFSEAELRATVQQCSERGVTLKWFGAAEPEGYTSRYDSWRYVENMPKLLRTEELLSTLCDMRVPLTFNEEDCSLIVSIIGEVLALVQAS